jgi:hypothetical protein
MAAFDIAFMDPLNLQVIDINAIEAVGQDVIPEPAASVLFAPQRRSHFAASKKVLAKWALAVGFLA